MLIEYDLHNIHATSYMCECISVRIHIFYF